MNFFEKLIKRTVSDAVTKTIGKTIEKAIEPTVTDLANKAADAMNTAAKNAETEVKQSTGIESAMANLEQSVQNYATQAAKNMKICPQCQKPASADKKFCPKCGTQLPDETVAQGAVCSHCGKQNNIGTKFCTDCGTKLPAAIQEEQAAAKRNAHVMQQWDNTLSQYPKWDCGGSDFTLEEHSPQYYTFYASFDGNHNAAANAVAKYRDVLLQNGFKQAGEYPCIEHLYKRIDGVVYHVDTEHCFDGDSDCPAVSFDKSEPRGGFDYVKPAPKKKFSFGDLFS